MATELPELLVEDVAAWHCWLQDHHTRPDGIWLVLAKGGHTEPTSLTYEEAVQEALCFGWIDGQMRRRDERTMAQRFTPRRARSRWSARNVGRVARLVATGRMQPAGQAEVDRAQADGRWDAAYEGSATISVPDDLTAALAAEPRAEAMFAVLTSANRYTILYQLGDAKRPETRARRIAKYVDMLARGETPYPQKRRPPTP